MTRSGPRRRGREIDAARGGVDGVAQHAQLGKGGDGGLRAPISLDVIHHVAPRIDVVARPVATVEQRGVQPAGENGVRCLGGGWEGGGGSRRRSSNGSQNTRGALFLDPLADLWAVEIVQIASAAAAG